MKRSTSKKAKPKSPAARQTSVNFEVIQEYTDFMKVNDLVEIDFKGKDYSVRLRRFEGPSSAGVDYAAAPVSPTSTSKSADSPIARSDLHVVKSPFVGTFYRSSGPNQEPFVEEGKIINSGDPLCIIEAMKLMNEIESDIKGRIIRVLVKNGTPVEFGEGLFEIEPV